MLLSNLPEDLIESYHFIKFVNDYGEDEYVWGYIDINESNLSEEDESAKDLLALSDKFGFPFTLFKNVEETLCCLYENASGDNITNIRIYKVLPSVIPDLNALVLEKNNFVYMEPYFLAKAALIHTYPDLEDLRTSLGIEE